MRVTSILHRGVMALVLTAGLMAGAPAFAASSNQSQAQAQQQSNTGPYDGAEFEASKQSLGQ